VIELFLKKEMPKDRENADLERRRNSQDLAKG